MLASVNMPISTWVQKEYCFTGPTPRHNPPQQPHNQAKHLCIFHNSCTQARYAASYPLHPPAGPVYSYPPPCRPSTPPKRYDWALQWRPLLRRRLGDKRCTMLGKACRSGVALSHHPDFYKPSISTPPSPALRVPCFSLCALSRT